MVNNGVFLTGVADDVHQLGFKVILEKLFPSTIDRGVSAFKVHVKQVQKDLGVYPKGDVVITGGAGRARLQVQKDH